MSARASSGSRSAISSVEPLISANSAVTVLRSPSGISPAAGSATTLIRAPAPGPGGGAWLAGSAPLPTANGAPHSPQNFFVSGFSVPHLEQELPSCAPQSPQNFFPSGLSEPQFAQRICVVPNRLRAQLLSQRLRILQVGGVEALSEPAVDFGQHRARLVALALPFE